VILDTYLPQAVHCNSSTKHYLYGEQQEAPNL